MFNVARYFPTRVLNFTLKNNIKKFVKAYIEHPSLLLSVASGTLSGTLNLLIVYPLDT